MQPAQAEGGGSSSNNLKKWGPIGAIVLVVALVAGIVLATSSGDDDDDADGAVDTTTAVTEPDTTDAPDSTEPDGTDAPDSTEPDGTEPGGGGDITFPLSFSQAAEQGVDVDWGERCDTETGNVAVKWFFAPECYAPFDGDNGGDTTRGVTADTIKIVQYQGPDDDPIINYLSDAVSVDDTNAESQQTATDMLGMFEQFYEFYGRTIELEFYESTGLANDEVTARADAVRIAEDFEPFAVLGGPALTSAFADELTAREVMCIGCTPGQPPEWYAERDPFVYGLAISAAQARTHGTEFITKQLVGGNAEFAGEEFQSQPRTFGHVWISSSPSRTSIAAAFEADLTEDGATVVEIAAVHARSGDDPGTGVPDHRQAEGVGCHDGGAGRRWHRTARLHQRGNRPGVLPRVGDRGAGAGRPHGVRSDLRPGAVGARLRCHPRCRSGDAGDRRLLRAVHLVHGCRTPSEGHHRAADAELHLPGRKPPGDRAEPHTGELP